MHKKSLSFFILFLFSADIFADNRSLDFDGVNDYVINSNLTGFNFSNSNEITIEVWFMLENHSGYDGIVSMNSNGIKYRIMVNPSMHPYYDAGMHWDQAVTNFTFNLNTWYHYAMVVSGGGNADIYVDGTLISSSPTAVPALLPNSTQILIGTGEGPGVHPSDALIDECRIWNTALTSAEIQSYMSTPPIGSEPGLVGYWNFNEGSGSILTDQTSNGNNGSIVGATWSDDVPVFGCTDPYADNYNSNSDADDGSCAGYPSDGEHSLSFDGSGDYVSVTSPSIPIGDSHYTIEAWIYTESMNSRGWIGWGNYGSWNQVNALRLSGSGIYNYWWGYDLHVTVNVAGGWHHVTATYDGNTRSIYVDGVLIGSDYPSTPHNVPNSNNFRIGSTNMGEWWNGKIDEIKIWDYARSPSEIVNNMDSGINGNEQGLNAYYKFNAGTGNVLYDNSGNQNHGTINNATWNNDVPQTQNAAPEATTQSVTGNEDAAQTITLAGSDADGDALTYSLATNPSNGTATLGDRVSLNFDGNDDYVELPLDNGVISSGTITSWVKFNSEIFNNGHTGIYSVGGGAFGGGSVCLLGLHTNYGTDNLRFGIYISGSGWYWVDSGISPTIGVWYNVVSTWGAGGLKIYVNGELKATNTNYTGGIPNNGDHFIGSGNQPNSGLNGNIDEVSFWDRALTQEEIQSSMSLGFSGDEDGLVGYWNFNEGTGSTLTDQTSNGNDGTINGGASWNNEANVVVSYTPNANYNGSDSFTYTVSDGQLTSEAATVNISIIAVNDAPTASAQSASGNEDAVQTITLAGSDVDGDALTNTIESNPSHGTLSTEASTSFLTFDGSNDYVHVPDLTSCSNATVSFWGKHNGADGGYDRFIGNTGHKLNIAKNGGGQLKVYTPGIGWKNVNHALSEDVWTYITITSNGTTLIVYVNGSEVSSFGQSNLNISDSDDWYFASHHGPGEYGNISMDEIGIWNEALSQSEITAIYNSGTSIDLSSNSGSYQSTANLKGYWKFDEGSGSTVTDVSGNGNDGVIYGAAWSGESNANAVTYTPNANYHGTDSFTYTVSDGSVTSQVATVTLTIAPVNDLPEITSAYIADVNQGSNYSYTIETQDIDGDVVTISSTGPSWLTISGDTLSGVAPDDVGLHNVVLTADDGNGETSSQSFTIAANATSTTISGESGFRMLSSPVSGAGVYADLLDELWTQGMAGSDDPNNGSANAWTWTNNGWQAIADLDNDIYEAGTGVLVYVFSDANFDGLEDDLPLDLHITTPQVSQDIDIDIDAPSNDEWRLVGNPYGVPMDISMMTERNKDQSNVRPAIHVYDPQAKQYRVHNGTTGEGILAAGHLAPFQAFWVHSRPGEHFRFDRGDRLAPAGGNGRSTVDSTGSALIAFNSAHRSSSTHMSFNLHGQVDQDAADGVRLMPLSNQDHLVSMFYMSDEALAINNLPYDFNADIAVDLDVMMLTGSDEGFETTAEEITMNWDFSQLPPGISMTLMDNITHELINMNETDSYTLALEPKGGFVHDINTVSAYPSVGESRFTIFMSSATAGGSEELAIPETFSLHPAYPNPFNPSTTIHYSLDKTSHVQLKVYNIMGREVATLVDKMIAAGEHRLKWSPGGNLAAGVYMVQINNGQKVFNQRITFLK